LVKDGDFSEPVQTASGFHILQRVRLKPLDSLNKIKNSIISKISRDSRQYRNTLAVYNKAKTMYKFKENGKYADLLKKYIDSSLLQGEFSSDTAKKKAAKLANLPLFTLTKVKKVYTLDSFAKWLSKVQKPSSSIALSGITQNYYEGYRLQMVMDFYEEDLDNTSEKFAALYKEYKEGILLFTLTDKKVWSRSVEDTVGLKNFYEQNAEKYYFKDRFDATIYRCANRNVAEDLSKELEKGITIDSLTRMYNKINPLSVSNPITGKFEQGNNVYADNLFVNMNNTAKYRIVEDPKIPGGFAVIQVHKFIPAGKKTLNEARGMIMSDYQTNLEKAWLDELMQKYPIVVDAAAYAVIKKRMTTNH
jgi:peptidyl-prolyl cis-trans isomerase SurA